MQGIKISFSNSVLSITMPGLLPKRKLRTNTAFLHEPLNLALQTYVTEHSIPLYKRCVVCFSQIYDQSLSLQRIRDYDNLEFKQILDTIASYVLVDDTGLFCDSYHTTELGNYDHTVIFVMELGCFLEKIWIRLSKTTKRHGWLFILEGAILAASSNCFIHCLGVSLYTHRSSKLNLFASACFR